MADPTTMPAGRELDEAVQAAVYPNQVECDEWTLLRHAMQGPEYAKNDCGHANCRPRGFVPAYSTDAGAAIQALQDLRRRGIAHLFIEIGTADDLPLAISRAIVAAHAAGLLGEKKEVNQNGL